MSVLVVHRHGDAAGNRVIRDLALRLALDAVQSLSARVQQLEEENQALLERARLAEYYADQEDWYREQEMERMREEVPHGMVLAMTIDGQIGYVPDLHSDADRDHGEEQPEQGA